MPTSHNIVLVAIEVDSKYTSYIFQVSDIELQKRFADLWTDYFCSWTEQHKFHQKLVANKRHFSKAYFPLEIVLLLLAFILHFHSVVVEVDRTPI